MISLKYELRIDFDTYNITLIYFKLRVSTTLFEGCVAAREKAVDARKFEIYQYYCH